MKHLKAYQIQFSGLSLGKHQFNFDIDKRFFDCYEYSIVKDGTLKVEAVLDKQERMMLLDLTISGTIKLTCDVCLREFDRDTHIDAQLIIKFSGDDEVEGDGDDDIVVLNRNEYEFSLADLLYEHINVDIPHYVRCDEQGSGEGCDQEMIAVLQKLEPKAGEGESQDPRWAMLGKLKMN